MLLLPILNIVMTLLSSQFAESTPLRKHWRRAPVRGAFDVHVFAFNRPIIQMEVDGDSIDSNQQPELRMRQLLQQLSHSSRAKQSPHIEYRSAASGKDIAAIDSGEANNYNRDVNYLAASNGPHNGLANATTHEIITMERSVRKQLNAVAARHDLRVPTTTEPTTVAQTTSTTIAPNAAVSVINKQLAALQMNSSLENAHTHQNVFSQEFLVQGNGTRKFVKYNTLQQTKSGHRTKEQQPLRTTLTLPILYPMAPTATETPDETSQVLKKPTSAAHSMKSEREVLTKHKQELMSAVYKNDNEGELNDIRAGISKHVHGKFQLNAKEAFTNENRESVGTTIEYIDAVTPAASSANKVGINPKAANEIMSIVHQIEQPPVLQLMNKHVPFGDAFDKPASDVADDNKAKDTPFSLRVLLTTKPTSKMELSDSFATNEHSNEHVDKLKKTEQDVKKNKANASDITAHDAAKSDTQVDGKLPGKDDEVAANAKTDMNKSVHKLDKQVPALTTSEMSHAFSPPSTKIVRTSTEAELSSSVTRGPLKSNRMQTQTTKRNEIDTKMTALLASPGKSPTSIPVPSMENLALVNQSTRPPKPTGESKGGYGKGKRKGTHRRPDTDSDEEIEATNWWHILPYTEIRKFLNTIYESIAYDE